MPIELKMPALSPTMEEGTLAKWLVDVGSSVRSGDVVAEIETDKATMELEAVGEGTIAQILVAAGSDGVKVGAVIAIMSELQEEAGQPAAGEVAASVPAPPATEGAHAPLPPGQEAGMSEASTDGAHALELSPPPIQLQADVRASPLARRLAARNGLDLSILNGSGPAGRIVRADVDAHLGTQQLTSARQENALAPERAASAFAIPDVPHEVEKLSNMRRTIARRLTESKQQVPHIYLTVDVCLDSLLRLRADLNAGLEPRGVRLSINDLLIKALAAALMEVPACNVMFAGDQLVRFQRADISVAVSMTNGLITPVVAAANIKSLSAIAAEANGLVSRARAGKLQPAEYQGGTACLSNLGMYGIKQFGAVINPPQGMIMAVGAGEKRPYVIDGELGLATVMSATGSFDHRAIDGADAAKLMQVFQRLAQNPLELLV